MIPPLEARLQFLADDLEQRVAALARDLRDAANEIADAPKFTGDRYRLTSRAYHTIGETPGVDHDEWVAQATPPTSPEGH